jgi:hypothetical protein
MTSTMATPATNSLLQEIRSHLTLAVLQIARTSQGWLAVDSADPGVPSRIGGLREWAAGSVSGGDARPLPLRQCRVSRVNPPIGVR